MKIPVPALPSPAARLAGFVVLSAAVVASSVAPDRRAAGADVDGMIAPVAVLVPDESLDPRIVALELSGPGWSAAVERLDAALFEKAENDREIRSVEQMIVELRAEQRTLTADRRRTSDAIEAIAGELTDVEAILRARALQRYVHLGDEPLTALVDPTTRADEQRATTLGTRVDEVQLTTRAELVERRESQTAELGALDGQLLQIGTALESASARHQRAMALQPELDDELHEAVVAVRRARRNASVAGVDISVVALDAYLNAERLLGEAFTGCNIEWWMIAGVARIESRHGEIGGRDLQAAGRPSSPIIGIALDGGPGVRAMHDTDGGRYDGDHVWDRAVGPLQFIPETWSRRGRDATGDGVADPQNIYDAAYSAGRYLCALGGDLSSRRALRAAYFGYNNSTAYVDAVEGHAERYADLDLTGGPGDGENEAVSTTSTVVEVVDNQPTPGD